MLRTTDLGEASRNLRMRLSAVAEEVVSFVRNRWPCLVSVQRACNWGRGCFNFHDKDSVS